MSSPAQPPYQYPPPPQNQYPSQDPYSSNNQYPGGYPQQAAPPPTLSWVVVLIISVFTGGIFSVVWLLIQSSWIRKTTGNSKPYTLSLVALVCDILYFLSAYGLHNGAITFLAWLGLMVTYIMAAFALRALLQPILRRPLGGAMTFFFNSIYFQYHLTPYALGQTGGAVVSPQSNQYGQPQPYGQVPQQQYGQPQQPQQWQQAPQQQWPAQPQAPQQPQQTQGQPGQWPPPPPSGWPPQQ